MPQDLSMKENNLKREHPEIEALDTYYALGEYVDGMELAANRLGAASVHSWLEGDEEKQIREICTRLHQRFLENLSKTPKRWEE